MPSPRRIDDDVFFNDGSDQRPEPGDDGSARSRAVEDDEFFDRPAPPSLSQDAWLKRTARDPRKLGGVMLGLGFWAVFVQQANIIHQIVLVAPIFEELFKFGLALTLVGLLRIRVGLFRLAFAAAVGGAFGWLEHAVTYAAEQDLVYAIRVGFHSGSTVLSMAVYHVVEGMGDVRVRWGSTAASTAVHYANNVTAVLLGIATVSGAQVNAASIGVIASMTAATWILALMVLVGGRAVRAVLRRWFPEPDQVRFHVHETA